MNRKAPAFQFYADDFISGTHWLTAEECGVYIRLLCHQWTSGPMPWHVDRLSRIAGVDSSEFNRIWETIQEKFDVDSDGKIFNKRLEEVRREAEEFRQSKSEAGKIGAKKRWQSHDPANSKRIANAWQADGKRDGKAMANDMANTMAKNGSPSPSPSPTPTPTPSKTPPSYASHTPPPQGEPSKRKRFKKPDLKEVAAYCRERKNSVNAEAFIDHYESKGWVVGRSPMKDWEAAVRTWEKNEAANDNGKIDPIEQLRRMRDDV